MIREKLIDSKPPVLGVWGPDNFTNGFRLLYYIIRRASGGVVAQDAIAQILTDLTICAVDRDVLEQALQLNFQDFEDAVQYACAAVHQVDAIVTRDRSGFIEATIPVISPEEIDRIVGQ